MSKDYKHIDSDYIYADPETGELRNLANITDEDILRFAESGAVTKRAKELYENPIKIINVEGLFAVHKHLLTLIFTFISLCLSAQDEKNQKVVDTVDVTYSVYELFSDIRLKNETIDLKIDFDSITKLEFQTYKKIYGQKIDTISKLISRIENSFAILASDTIFEFPTRTERTFWYKGFYPNLNSHLIGVSGAGICEMFFIDETSAKGLLIPEFYDSGCNQPMLSNDKKLLMTYGTCTEGKSCYEWYNQKSTILMIDVSDLKSITESKTYRYIHIDDFAIDEILWTEDNVIILKVFDEIAFDEDRQDYQKNIRYLKGKIEW